MTDDLIGKTIGGYEILDQIGRGGMATVYRARQTSMNRTVALKVLPRHFAQDDAYLQRFEREVKIIAQLEHRNIIPVHDYGEVDGQPFIVMRYMPAGSVDDLLKGGPLSAGQTLKIVQQIAPALDYAHSKNVLHRDLKPSNILLDDDGGAYITDFGIARIVGVEGTGSTITTQGVVGTPSYMSPEQAQGKAMDGRSDVYSLGIMLFEMLTGHRPFQNETPYGIAVMQVTTNPPSPRSINPQISAEVEQVILKSLKKIPDNRYQTAVYLAEALKVAIEHPEMLSQFMRDTQPTGYPTRKAQQSYSDLEVTQPSAVFQPTVPSEALPQTLPPTLPPPAQAPASSAYSRPGMGMPQGGSQGMSHVPARFQPRKKRSGFWISIVIGGLIGCGLLAAVVTGGLLVLDRVLDTAPAVTLTPSPAIPQSVDDTAILDAAFLTYAAATELSKPSILPEKTAIPTLDGTSEAERQRLLGTASLPVATSNSVLPPGIRPTFEALLTDQLSKILYFAEADGRYNLFTYDLMTRRVEQLTDDAESSYPQLSPDGGRVVFQSNRDGDFDIYTLDLASGVIVRLTNNDVVDRLPAWSPDGEWVVYASDTNQDGNHDLYRVRATGTGQPELLYRDGNRNSHPRYSYDGSRIVFTGGLSGDASTWEIKQLDITTGEVTLMTDNTVRDASPQFSPDDETIMFVTDGVGGAAIATMPADGTGTAQILYDGDGFERSMSYSPNGNYIVFNVEEGNASEIFLMRTSGANLRQIEDINGFYPSWMPDR